MRKKNYLNNRDILKEIHKSKCNHSRFVSPKYKDNDVTVHSIDDIDQAMIESARVNRAKRLSQDDDVNGTYTSEDIPVEDLVFRVMAWDHIPDAPDRKKNKKTVADTKEKVNFPPFQHWAYVGGELAMVGKSHWTGDLLTGEFSVTSGKSTDKLAMMWLKLIDRYSMRSNVRSYSYLDEMREQALIQLTYNGLQFDESKSNNPFAYYSQIVYHSFVKIMNTEKRHQDTRDDLLEDMGLEPSHTRTINQEWEMELKRNGVESPLSMTDLRRNAKKH